MSYDAEWFGDCANTWHEEQKQFAYMSRMGLLLNWNVGHPPEINIGGRSVVDIGGGPASILLKCVNLGHCLVADPAPYPSWVRLRYEAHGVSLSCVRGEDFRSKPGFDEAWIYNVLQHTHDPARVIARARKYAKVIRIFEWIGIPAYEGHPHELSKELLDEWLGAFGFVADVNEHGAVGAAYYGVFATD